MFVDLISRETNSNVDAYLQEAHCVRAPNMSKLCRLYE